MALDSLHRRWRTDACLGALDFSATRISTFNPGDHSPQAVAITAGASAATTTTGSTAGASVTPRDAKHVARSYKGMTIFTVAKGGLMYEASIGGQKFNYRKK
jgi:hypothetical protein